jgi:hypothetical protein
VKLSVHCATCEGYEQKSQVRDRETSAEKKDTANTSAQRRMAEEAPAKKRDTKDISIGDE